MESPLEGSQHREPWSQQQRERAAGRYRARLRSRARLRCHVRHFTRRLPRAVRRLKRRGKRPCSEGWGAGWPCRSSLAPEETCADRGGSRSVGGGDAACERLHPRRATGVGCSVSRERGRKQVDGRERAVCVWCVCVRFGLRTLRLRVARKRGTAGLCVRWAIRQGRGRGSVGEGKVGWRRTLLEDRSPSAQCSPATSSLLRVAQVGGGLKHTAAAASGVRTRRRGSLGARQPHRRGVCVKTLLATREAIF